LGRHRLRARAAIRVEFVQVPAQLVDDPGPFPRRRGLPATHKRSSTSASKRRHCPGKGLHPRPPERARGHGLPLQMKQIRPVCSRDSHQKLPPPRPLRHDSGRRDGRRRAQVMILLPEHWGRCRAAKRGGSGRAVGRAPIETTAAWEMGSPHRLESHASARFVVAPSAHLARRLGLGLVRSSCLALAQAA
jgi:hypothetical protein